MNTVAFRPLGNRYLILPDEQEVESETIGDITLSGPPPDPHKRSFEGTVVAKGKSCVELEIGDKAVYGEFSGYEQMVDGTRYLVLQEGEILGEHLITPFDERSFFATPRLITAITFDLDRPPDNPRAAIYVGSSSDITIADSDPFGEDGRKRSGIVVELANKPRPSVGWYLKEEDDGNIIVYPPPSVPSLTTGLGQAPMEAHQIIGTIDLRDTGGAPLPLEGIAASNKPTHILTITEAPEPCSYCFRSDGQQTHYHWCPELLPKDTSGMAAPIPVQDPSPSEDDWPFFF